MVRDRDVLIAPFAASFSHLFKRGAAVGLGRVHVQIAANVREIHQFR